MNKSRMVRWGFGALAFGLLAGYFVEDANAFWRRGWRHRCCEPVCCDPCGGQSLYRGGCAGGSCGLACNSCDGGYTVGFGSYEQQGQHLTTPPTPSPSNRTFQGQGQMNLPTPPAPQRSIQDQGQINSSVPPAPAAPDMDNDNIQNTPNQ